MNQQPPRSNRALAFLDKYEPKGRKEKADCQKTGSEPKKAAPTPEKVAPEKPAPKPEIIPPAPKQVARPEKTETKLMPSTMAVPTIKLPRLPEPADITPRLDGVLRRYEQLIETALETFNVDEPEGFVDTYLVTRMGHRVAVKIERSGQVLQLFENFQQILANADAADEKIRALNRRQMGEYAERLKVVRATIEEWNSVQYAAAAAARREAVDAAKAEALIETYKAQAAKARQSALPPPPQVLLPPRDLAAERREEARRKRWETLDLGLDEKEDHASAAEEEVMRAKARCIAIYRDVAMREGEKRARIQKVLDEFGFDWSILPVAIEDLMIRGYEEVSQ